MLELILSFDEYNADPKYIQLYKYLKDEIESMRIKAYEKIPSVRNAAKQLHVSRTTIENSYSQLLLEGYIYSKDKSGYFACDLGTILPYKKTDIGIEKFVIDIPDRDNNEFIDEGYFNFTSWKKCYNSVLEYNTKELMLHGDPQGEMKLRKELKQYVYRSRGVICSGNQIIIGAGVQVLLGILCVLLKRMSISEIAFEEPGFTDVWHIFKDYGFNMIPVSVDEKGLNVGNLAKTSAQICYVSPSHQYPTGIIMPVGNRLNLLEWSKNNNAYIIEDDYDSELRYSGNPVPSLQSMDQYKKIIYMGSFSTVFLPSIRISYMILPDNLIELYNKYGRIYNQTSSKIEQLALANYISKGEFDRHLRRIRKIFANKYIKINNHIKGLCKDNVKILESNSGTNIILIISNSTCTLSVKDILSKKGISVKLIKENMIVLKFTTIPDNKLEKVAAFIADCVC